MALPYSSITAGLRDRKYLIKACRILQRFLFVKEVGSCGIRNVNLVV